MSRMHLYQNCSRKEVLKNSNLVGVMRVCSGLHSLEVAFPPHDSNDAGSNLAEVVEFLRMEKFREQVLQEGL
jgi:hypothetical protein